jgi:hypothetical protein
MIYPHFGGTFFFGNLPESLDALGQRRTFGKAVFARVVNRLFLPLTIAPSSSHI